MNNKLGSGYCPSCLKSKKDCTCLFDYSNCIINGNDKPMSMIDSMLNKHNPKYIGAINYLVGCPIHESSNYECMKTFNNINEIKEYSLSNLNDYEIFDIISLNGDNIRIEYVKSSHSYIGVKLFNNNILISETFDNGSGELYWKDANK